MKALQTVLLLLVLARGAYSADTNGVASGGVVKSEPLIPIDQILRTQTNAASNLGENNLLSVTVLTDEGTWYRYIVKENGKEHDWRGTWYARQNQHWGELSEKEISKLRALVAELPVESAHPPLGRTVLVSFRSGSNWVTRTYDSKEQPTALRGVFQAIAEREELKRKQ